MFKIGDEFIETYPQEAIDWCNENCCWLKEEPEESKHYVIVSWLNNEPETPENIISNYTQAIQDALDNFAKTKQYDGILSVCSYVNSTDPYFKQEADYCVHLRDTTWRQAYNIMDEVLAGNRPLMTIEELIAELPVGSAEWPAEE